MLCHQLEALRGKANLTYKQIASMCNLSEMTVTRICTGETAEPNFSTVSSIVAACGGSLDEIAGLRPAGELKSPFEVMADKYEARLASTKEVYDQQIAQLNESFDSQLARLAESHTREITQITESNERRIKELNEGFAQRNRELNENFERRIAENSVKEEKRLAEADEREKRHFYAMGAIIILLLAAIFYLILDAMHGNWGIFQYSELLATLGKTGMKIFRGVSSLL